MHLLQLLALFNSFSRILHSSLHIGCDTLILKGYNSETICCRTFWFAPKEGELSKISWLWILSEVSCELRNDSIFPNWLKQKLENLISTSWIKKLKFRIFSRQMCYRRTDGLMDEPMDGHNLLASCEDAFRNYISLTNLLRMFLMTAMRQAKTPMMKMTQKNSYLLQLCCAWIYSCDQDSLVIVANW